jgi:hypothetical protein
VQPDPPPLLNEREYVPVAVGVIAGFVSVDVKPSGPLQFHEVASDEFAFNVVVPPTHKVPETVIPEDDGASLTVASTVYVWLHPVPDPLFTVTV